jgi:hypothetical protein
MKSVDTRGAFEILLLQAIYGQSLAGSNNLVMWAFSTISHHHMSSKMWSLKKCGKCHFSIFVKPYKSPDNFQNTMLTTDLFGPSFTNYISK